MPGGVYESQLHLVFAQGKALQDTAQQVEGQGEAACGDIGNMIPEERAPRTETEVYLASVFRTRSRMISDEQVSQPPGFEKPWTFRV